MSDIDLGQVSILLIDDSKPVRTVVKTLLKGLGADRIFEGADGDEALVLARAGRIDIAIIDKDLGHACGLDVVREFRQSPLSPDKDVPIILMDPIGADHVAREAELAGADIVVSKPVSAKTLGAHITALVSGEAFAVRDRAQA